MYCSNCGVDVGDNAQECPDCGQPTNVSDKSDNGFGAQRAYSGPELDESEVDNRLRVADKKSADGIGRYVEHHDMRFINHKKRSVAFLLCLFAGYLGAHRFYTGKFSSGIAYSFTLGLLGVGWVIDLLAILFGTFRDVYGQRLI